MILAASEGLTAGLILTSGVAVLTSALAYIKGRQGDHIVESAHKDDRIAKSIDQALAGNQALIDDMREESAHWRQDALECRQACEQLRSEYKIALERLGKVEMENEDLRRHIQAQDRIIGGLREHVAQLLEERA